MRYSKVYFVVAALATLLSVFDWFSANWTGFLHAVAGSAFILFLITHIFGAGVDANGDGTDESKSGSH
jgi:hypothetical protein